MHKKPFSILVENKGLFIREDSQIDFATGNFFELFSQTSTPLPAFQPKIDNWFKMCLLDNADEAATRPTVYANGADRQPGMSLPMPNFSKFK